MSKDEAFEKWYATLSWMDRECRPDKVNFRAGWNARGERDAELLEAYRKALKLLKPYVGSIGAGIIRRTLEER